MPPGYFKWTGPNLPSGSVEFYRENGYVILVDHATKEETSRLRARARTIMKQFDPNAAEIFSTGKQARDHRLSSKYFLESSRKVCCFLEEKRKNEVPELSVNKIGHCLHDKDSDFKEFSRLAKVSVIAKELGYRKPLLVQSMYICKQPVIGGEVTSHRDSTFIGCVGKPCLGYWWALEDATEGNGCLWVVPGSHCDGVSTRMIVEKDEHEEGRKITKFVGEEQKVYGEKGYVAVPMEEGSLILIHGALVHKSLANFSNKSRHAYSIHVIDSPPWTIYCKDNWLQTVENDPFVGFD